MTSPVMMVPVMRMKTTSLLKEKKDQNLKGREENILEGRIVIKITQPSVPFTKKRTSQEEIPIPEKLSKMDRATQVEIQPSKPPAHGKLVHASTLTSPKKRIVVTTTVETQTEGEADVKVISKGKLFMSKMYIWRE